MTFKIDEEELSGFGLDKLTIAVRSPLMSFVSPRIMPKLMARLGQKSGREKINPEVRD